MRCQLDNHGVEDRCRITELYYVHLNDERSRIFGPKTKCVSIVSTHLDVQFKNEVKKSRQTVVKQIDWLDGKKVTDEYSFTMFIEPQQHPEFKKIPKMANSNVHYSSIISMANQVRKESFLPFNMQHEYTYLQEERNGNQRSNLEKFQIANLIVTWTYLILVLCKETDVACCNPKRVYWLKHAKPLMNLIAH